MIIVIVVFVKLVLARYLIREGKRQDSEIISASGKESFSDVISSAVVFVGVLSVILGNYFESNILLKGDKIASIIIAAFIIRIGIIIIIDAVKSLQGRSVKKEICMEYAKIVESVDGVIRIDQLDMVAYGPYYQAIIEIAVKGNITVTEGHDIAEAVHDVLMIGEKICHVSVHVNPELEHE